MGRLRRGGLPVRLGVGCLASGVAAAAIEAGGPESGDPVGGPSLVTPVVSARRLPTVLAAPIAERRLRDDLIAWLASQPADTCLVVEGDEGEISVDHRGEVPLVPASTPNLLTGTAALEEIGRARGGKEWVSTFQYRW